MIEPLCRPTTGRFGRLSLTALIVLLAVLGLLVGPLSGAAHADQGRMIKVYTVRSPAQNGGVADTLPEIAQRTLGNPARASDIFNLNKGRKQADGGVLTRADQTLNPGWILRLPSDASGPFVQLVPDTSHSKRHREILTMPIALAVLGGVLLIVVTLLIVLRRRAASGVRRLGRLVSRLTEPLRRRKALRSRRYLAPSWRADAAARGAARVALAEVTQAAPPDLPGPIAVDLYRNEIHVFPAPPVPAVQPWLADEAFGWIRQTPPGGAPDAVDPAGRPVLVGGWSNGITYVDLSYCDGALALAGDPNIATEVLVALVNDVATHQPQLRIACLGEPPPGMAAADRLLHAGDLAAAIIPRPSPHGALVVAAAERRVVTGLIAASATTPPEECAELARLCSTPGSTWLAVIAQDVPGAHWRWVAQRDGTLWAPSLDRSLVATA